MSIPVNVRTQERCLLGSQKTYRLAIMALAVSVAGTAYAADAKAAAPAAKPASAAAASVASEGSITGRVLNVGTGMYLSKATVKVENSNFETLTDDYGNFELRDVPVGKVTVSVSYTGLQTTSIVVDVVEGVNFTEEIKLSRTGKGQRLSKKDGDVVEMDEFVVASERFKNASEIAINEERYSPTIKNVVSADAFGDIPDGNIGDFVKYIPGVQIGTGYTNAASNASEQNATSISVRGFAPEMTNITLDGVNLTNASPASLSRAIGLDMMSINNASRVEVIKVPTADMPSNSPGGSVNLITKSAFEYAKPRFDVKVFVTANTKDFKYLTDKTPGPANKATYKTLPGADFSYVVPINKKFGVSVTGGWSKVYNENFKAQSTWLYDTKSNGNIDLRNAGGDNVKQDGTGTATLIKSQSGAYLDPTNPVLYKFAATTTPNTNERTSGGLKLDWRPSTGQKVQFGYTLGMFSTQEAQRRMEYYIGKGAYASTWGEDYMVSYKYTAKGTVFSNGYTSTAAFDPGAKAAMTVTTRDRESATHTGYIDYSLNKGPWKIDANINGSRSRGAYVDFDNNHFSEIESSISGGQLIFRDIKNGIPGQVLLYDKSGNNLDYTQLSNWSSLTSSTKFKSGNAEALDQNYNMKFNVRRDLDFIPWSWISMSAKAGAYRVSKTVKKWGLGTGYYVSYTGTSALALSNYLDSQYTAGPGFGRDTQQWLDTYKMYEMYKANSGSFGVTSGANEYDNYMSMAGQNKKITETSDQVYAMIDGKTLRNRLSFNFGVRQEFAKREGYATKYNTAWKYVTYDDGSLYRTSSGSLVSVVNDTDTLFATTTAGTALRAELDAAGVKYPTSAIKASTLAAAQRYAKLYSSMDAKVNGKPTYLASFAFDITKQLSAHLSYNRSQAKPDFENGTLGTLKIDESVTAGAYPAGTITIPNTELKPWKADSYDFQLAYYTKSGGKFAVSPYYKQVSNFQETFTIYSDSDQFNSLLTNAGLDPTLYQDYAISTTLNGSGVQKVIGYELEASQNLGVLGSFGRYFYVFGSFSHQYKKQNNNNANISGSKPTSNTTASGGISIDVKRLSVQLRGTWLEEKYESLVGTYYLVDGTAIKINQYAPSTIQLDINARYKLTQRFGLFASAKNFLNTTSDKYRYDKTGYLPSYAKYYQRYDFGVNVTFGITASF